MTPQELSNFFDLSSAIFLDTDSAPCAININKNEAKRLLKYVKNVEQKSDKTIKIFLKNGTALIAVKADKS